MDYRHLSTSHRERRNSLLSPIYLALYAEMHYTFPHCPSFLKRRQPEIVADLPYRVEPRNRLPILCLIKDANRYPICLEQVSVYIKYGSGRSQAACFSLEEKIESLCWHRIFAIDPLETGLAAVDVEFRFRDGKGTHTAHNDNYRLTSHTPLVVQIASEPLPRNENWYYGETHFHSIYTSDQVEFGSPVAAAALLAQAMGFHWLAVTDHSYDLDNYPGDAVRNHPALPLWEQLRAEVTELNLNTPNFVTLMGEEISCGNRWRRNVHLLGYGLDQFIPGSGDSAEKLLQVSPELSIGEVLAKIEEQGGVAFAAHPCATTPLPERVILQRRSWGTADFEDARLSGLQFWNGLKSPGFHRGRQRWIRLLLEGRRLFALGGNDAHGDFGRSRHITVPFLKIGEAGDNRFGKVRTCLLGEGKLSEKSVLDALRNGSCVITDGPLVTFSMQNEQGKSAKIGGTLTGRSFTLQMEAKTTAEFGDFESIDLWCGFLPKKEERKTSALRRPHPRFVSIPNLRPEGPCYFRIEARTRKGGLCITNPIWLNPSG